MISFFFHCKQIWDRCVKDEITVYAAQASFFIVTAFFPFIMLLLTLIQFLPNVGKSDLLAVMVRIMPKMLHSLVVSIVDDLYIKSPGTILSATALTALWSAAKGMLGIERGLNRIYGDFKHRNYILQRLLCSFYTLIFMLVCVMSLVLLIFGPLCHQPAFSVCADCIFAYLHRTLRHRSLQKTKTAAAASWSCLYRGRMAGIFLCLFYLFYTFQQFFLHVWEPDSHCPPDAVALHLHLYPVYWSGVKQFPEPGACSEPVSGALT